MIPVPAIHLYFFSEKNRKKDTAAVGAIPSGKRLLFCCGNPIPIPILLQNKNIIISLKQKTFSILYLCSKLNIMSLKNFLTSRVFIKQLIIAFLILGVSIFLLLQWLNFSTNHGEEIIVPNLKKLSVAQMEDKLESMDLNYEITDSIDFKEDFPVGSVVEQDPLPNTKVKKNRKIYVRINSSGYAKIKLPDYVQKTYRQVLPSLLSLGLEEGKITYRPNLAKDMVLEVSQNGKILREGDEVLKKSKIDLVLGDGKIGFDEQIDSTEIQ